MVFILLVVSVALIFFGGVAIYGGSKLIPESRGLKITGAVLAVLGGALFAINLGIREIGPGQVGVRVFTGQVQPGVMNPGLNWVVPMLEDIVIYDTRVQAYNFESIAAATDDLQAVAVTGQINFHIEPETAPYLLQEVGGPGTFASVVFLKPADEAIKAATPRYSAQDIVGKRREVGNIALNDLSADMKNYGIIVDRVTIANLDLDPEFMTSVEQKQIAEQEVATSEFRAQAAEKQAEGEANAAIQRARGEAERIKTVADAQAEANRALNESLTGDLLQWTAIQKLADKIEVMMVPSDQGFLIDLKGLQPEATPTP